MKGNDMDYGGFSRDKKEFIINRFDTPTPWINYLCNGKYAALISQTGGGYSFFEDPKYQRITRYRYNNVPLDRPGRYVYLRDSDTGEYWSAGWQPVCRAPDAWECRHGLGYTKISSANEGISSEVTYFVPQDDNLEVWSIGITNAGKKKRTITATPYAEFALFDASEEFMFHPNLHYFSMAEYDSRDKAIYYSFYNKKKEYFKRNFSRAFFAVTNRAVRGYDCEREAFIGRYHSETNPEAIKSGRHKNSKVAGGNVIGALSVRLELKPGERKEVTVVLGVDAYENKLTPDRILRKYSDESHVSHELERVKKYWEEYTSKLKVETPDAAVNANINTWNQYQSRTTFDWSRYASLMYNTGTGRGIGFRDTSQDTLGVVHAIAPQVKEKILLLAKNMYEDGHAYHLFYPTVGTGEPKKYSDDHLWIIPSVYSYICETGDYSILEDKAPYIEGSSGTVYEHMVRAVNYTLANCGPHGLPRMFYADWNDCLNDIDRKGRGESVWVAMFLCYVAKQMAGLAEELEKTGDAKGFTRIYDEMKQRINNTAWDGEWYMRAFTDDGRPVGSKECEEGKIHINTQSWAVLSGVAGRARGIKCMDSVKKYLDTDLGIRICWPSYTSSPEDIGSLINYPAGIKENGAIFCHANTWAVIAEAMLGRADRAFGYYHKLLPVVAAKKAGAETYRVEPYVYSQFLFGPDHPQFGRGSHSWLTGTSAWMFRAFTDWILGVRATLDGLMIDPRLPASWDGFTMKRSFRGKQYDINVTQGKVLVNGKLVRDGSGADRRTVPAPVS